MNDRHIRRRSIALCAAAIVAIVACSAQGSGDFETVDAADVPFGLADTTTTSTTTTLATTTTVAATTSTAPATTQTTIATTSTTVPTERVTLFLVAGTRLIPVERSLLPPIGPERVLAALQEGFDPDDDTAAGLRTLVPSSDEGVMTVEVDRGVAQVSVPQSLAELVEDGEYAFGQIVLTLLGVGGIGGVSFNVEGAPISISLGDGSLSEEGQIVHAEDYEELTR